MRIRQLVTPTVCVALLVACSPALQSRPRNEADAALTETRGPNGESPTASAALTLTDDEVAQIRAGHFTVAFLWHTSSDFTVAAQAGAQDEFTRLNIDVVATADAAFDPAKQRNDVETVLAKQPSAIIALPLDPTMSAESFRPAEQVTKLVFLSNVPAGYKQGTDYVSTVTDDLFQMGKQAADVLAASIGGRGRVGWIYHDAANYVTNQRDKAFRTSIQKNYPNIQIAAEQGIADPAHAESAANAMLTQTPDLDGLYVTFAEPAEHVLAVLRGMGNTRTKLVTLDLSEPLALDMLLNGNVVGIVADQAYELGRTMAHAVAYGLLGKQAPAFLVVPAFTVTRDNISQGWQQSLHRDPPASLVNAGR